MLERKLSNERIALKDVVPEFIEQLDERFNQSCSLSGFRQLNVSQFILDQLKV